MPESALLVAVPEVEHLVGPWRLLHGPVASRGIPAHVTALFPFVSPAAMTEQDLARVRDVAASTRPIEFRFASLDGFPGVIWLRPEPDDPFRELTAALWRAFPECPPHGCRYPDSRPHLTVATTAVDRHDALRDKIWAAVRGALPVTCRAESVSLFTALTRPGSATRSSA